MRMHMHMHIPSFRVRMPMHMHIRKHIYSTQVVALCEAPIAPGTAGVTTSAEASARGSFGRSLESLGRKQEALVQFRRCLSWGIS